MHRILVVSLFSSCALVAAAATPQPNNHDAASTPTAVTRVTTGVIAPQINSTAVIHIPADRILDTYPNPATMLVRLDVDASGKAAGIQILHSISPRVDANVLQAIRQMRWRPAVLDNQPIAMTVNLTVAVEH
ncbi:MAG TPA: TonB family protein [Acidobacteriaceae bacterium]|nr:TonB family protein [Acidobacteriaceae bacterium]